MSVIGACAEIAFGEACHVSELYAATRRVSEFSGARRPHPAVAHVTVHRFADLQSTGCRPPCALAGRIGGDLSYGCAGRCHVHIQCAGLHNQRWRELADGPPRSGRTATARIDRRLDVVEIPFGGVGNIRVPHQVAFAGVMGDDQSRQIVKLGERHARMRGLELFDSFQTVLQVHATVMGVDHGIGDAFGRCLVGAFGMHAPPYAPVHL